MNAIQDFLKTNGSVISDQTIERLLLVSMLHEAMSDPNYLPPIQPSTEADNHKFYEAAKHMNEDIVAWKTRAEYAEDSINEIRDALHGNPPRTDKAQLLMAKEIRELMQKASAPKAATGWNVPKIGDRLRVTKLPQDEGFAELLGLTVGEIVEVKNISCLARMNSKVTAYFIHPCEVAIYTTGKIIPLCCLEPAPAA